MLSLTLGVLSALSCGSPTTAPLRSTDGIVYGRVFDDAGQPVAGAQLRILAYRDSCDPPGDQWFDEPASAGADGRYRYRLRAPNFTEIPLCLDVRASVVRNGETLTGATSGARLTLYSEQSGRLDSTYVAITVR
jgi:hypothetical protein